MKTITLILLSSICFLLTQVSFAQGNVEWVKGLSSDYYYVDVQSTTTDVFGNIYCTGFFKGTVDFDPSPDSLYLTSAGDDDIFILKLNADGSFAWAQRFGDVNMDQGLDIAIDPFGHIYATGYFRGTTYFDYGSTTGSTAVGVNDIYILKLHPNGDFIWVKTYGGGGYDQGHSIDFDAIGNIYLAGSFWGTMDFDPGVDTFYLTSLGWDDAFVQKLDPNGNFIWAKSTGGTNIDHYTDIAVDAMGNCYLLGSFGGDADFDPGPNTLTLSSSGAVFLQKFDSNGNWIWAKITHYSPLNTSIGNTAICLDASGNIYLTGYISYTFDFDPGPGVFNLTAQGNNDGFVQKLDSNGDFIWAKSFGGIWGTRSNSITTDALGYVYTTGDFQSTVDFDPGSGVYNLTSLGNYHLFIQKLDVNGNFVAAKSFGVDSLNSIVYGTNIHVDDFGAIYAIGNFDGTIDFDGVPNVNSLTPPIGSSALYILKLNQNGIRGQVVVDSIINCVADTLEQGVAGMIVQFASNSDTLYTTTNAQGFYSTWVDTGTYTVSVINNNPYSVVCPLTQQVQVSSTPNNQPVNWAIRNTISCPYLTVDITAPFLRNTNGGSYYTVSYCNQGTVDAANAFVEVDMDANLTVLGSSIPISNQTGQVYTFNLGNVAVGQCGYFTIQVVVHQNSYPGQAHCTEAHIYPDSVCVQALWTGAVISTEGVCGTDSIQFTIQNSGAAMGAIRHYYVVEDNIMMRVDPFQLGSGQSTTILVEAKPGKTYRIMAEQEVGYPAILGDSVTTSVLEACVLRLDSSFNTGFVTQFSNGNSSPFIAVDCQQNVSSFDPNDKAAQPEGYDATNHYIYKNTALDYKIRFQNTGTDTAFNIIITDHIDPALDISTLEMGASSHAYTWKVSGKGILEVRFNNIMLADSNINEPLSHGFFKYRIQQKANNPLGTVINNTASIYFDYNAPILTNTTWHTVGENFVLTVSIDKIFDKTVEVLVYPNPFSQTATIEVKGKDYNKLNLSIFDVTGRQVAQEQAFGSNKIQVNKGAMQTGIYFYKLEGDGKLINSGKLIISE